MVDWGMHSPDPLEPVERRKTLARSKSAILEGVLVILLTGGLFWAAEVFLLDGSTSPGLWAGISILVGILAFFLGREMAYGFHYWHGAKIAVLEEDNANLRRDLKAAATALAGPVFVPVIEAVLKATHDGSGTLLGITIRLTNQGNPGGTTLWRAGVSLHDGRSIELTDHPFGETLTLQAIEEGRELVINRADLISEKCATPPLQTGETRWGYFVGLCEEPDLADAIDQVAVWCKDNKGREWETAVDRSVQVPKRLGSRIPTVQDFGSLIRGSEKPSDPQP